MDKLNRKFRSSAENDITQGVIHVHPKGFAFVSPDDREKYPEDIFIPKHLKGNAVDGDRVEVSIAPEKKPDKGPEGFVKSILERAKEELVGIVWVINPKGHYLLYIQSLGKSKTALVKRSDKAKYHIGDRLLIKVLDWGDEKVPALCSVIEKIGTIDQPQTDIPAAIKDFGIRKEFPKGVINQVKKFSSEVEKRDLKGREDLTHLETFTIDPDTARDFDDALSLTEDKKGHFHLTVHIADVSHYVEEGTPLDDEAKKRSNSTYFPGECVPMLPEELSNHLCSLKEKVIRLTISVIMELDSKGTVLNYKIVRGFINSQKRYTYNEAKEILDQTKKSPHYETLKRMEKLCLLLKKKRFERGSVDLALSEVVIKIDKKGRPTGYEIVEYDITHQLVEEFMLKANELVAEEFMKRGQNAVFRIHEPPGEDNLTAFYTLARSMGFPLPNKVEVSDIQKVFDLAKNTPYAEQLSIAYIRSMKLAIYSKENVGHFGLSLENYCHFTSPIRRYSDLVVHRLLFTKGEEDLDKIAKTCSERERVSFKAEMSVVMMKKLRLLELYQKKEPQRTYSGVVSKVKPFGIFFEVAPIQYEGFLHISALHDDYFEYNNESLVGQNTGKSYKVGSPLELLLEEVDLIVMESKWALNQPKKKKKNSLFRSTKKKKHSKSRKRS
ncbi:MAG: VacB/RNase II family 3'-5' exoribonuclease [Simkaniaceae bacterium]|nr:MAG: VacB/RNase II family 3'-5' exoribonuclease [Simkaniaceae bacterium]